MNRVRVLIIHPYRHCGGPDSYLRDLVRSMSDRGTRFWIMLAQERRFATILRDLGASVTVEPALQTLPRTLSPLRLVGHAVAMSRVVASTKRLVAAHNITLVHADHETLWPALMRLTLRSVGRIVSVHGLRFTSPAWVGHAHSQVLAVSTDRVVCVSDAVRSVFRHWGFPERKLTMIPSCVDLLRFRSHVSGAAFRREIGVSADVPLVGTVGSIDERKGLVYFLDACARLREQHPSARFVVVGHGDGNGPEPQDHYLRQLRIRASALALDRCLSFVPAREDMPEVMAALDVLVQPSLTEAGPLAPLEAMAMARPVVGTRVEGTAEEVVDGETGILVEPHDGLALAEAIAALLENPHRRMQMGREGQARVNRLYALTTAANLIERVYQETSGGAEL